jgi:hypothetical protein
MGFIIFVVVIAISAGIVKAKGNLYLSNKYDEEKRNKK